MFNRQANLSIELLLSFMVFGICSLLTLQIFQLFAKHQSPGKESITLGIMQLQKLVAVSEIQRVNEDEVVLLYQSSEVILKESNGSLIRTPGTVIYLNPIQDVVFWMDEELLYVGFYWHQKEYRYVLGKKEWWRD